MTLQVVITKAGDPNVLVDREQEPLAVGPGQRASCSLFWPKRLTCLQPALVKRTSSFTNERTSGSTSSSEQGLQRRSVQSAVPRGTIHSCS